MPGNTQLFRTVRVARASGDIVQQIRNNIFQGRLAPGDKLPTEKELAEQFGLSRITVRDAMRVLESQGLITIKVGAGGGAFVASPSAEPASQVLNDMLRLQRVPARELVEARLVVDVSLAGFAAERASSEELAAMQCAIDAARTEHAAGGEDFTPHSVAFHQALARAAKNQVLFFTWNTFRGAFYETLEKLVPDDSMAVRAIADHQKLLNAIGSRDAETARQVMRAHLSYFEMRVVKLAS